MSASSPMVIGHRGAPGHRPEHTRSSYRLALMQGAGGVEPDVVVSSDGVLVVRHESEISGTTDVAAREEFADRRTTKTVDSRKVTGFFAEDFTWDELRTLRARERLPALRPDSAAHDGAEPILRLEDVFAVVAEASTATGRTATVTVEIKHATFFAEQGWDLPTMVADAVRAPIAAGIPVVIESFEPGALAAVRRHGVQAPRVLLIEKEGAPADLVAAQGRRAPDYASFLTPHGLDALAETVEGISVHKRLITAPDRRGRLRGPTPVVERAHERGLEVFTWTCRPENAFLPRSLRRGHAEAAYGDYRAEWRMLADAGVDAVFTDHPDLALAVFGRSAPERLRSSEVRAGQAPAAQVSAVEVPAVDVGPAQPRPAAAGQDGPRSSRPAAGSAPEDAPTVAPRESRRRRRGGEQTPPVRRSTFEAPDDDR